MSNYVEGTHGQLLYAPKKRIELIVCQTYHFGDACEECGQRTALVGFALLIDGKHFDNFFMCGQCSRKFHSQLEARTDRREETFRRNRKNGKWNSKTGRWRTGTEMKELARTR